MYSSRNLGYFDALQELPLSSQSITGLNRRDARAEQLLRMMTEAELKGRPPSRHELELLVPRAAWGNISRGTNVAPESPLEKKARRTEALAGPFTQMSDMRVFMQPKSLENLAAECRVSVAGLETHIKLDMAFFCVHVAEGGDYSCRDFSLLMDKIYNLFAQSQQQSCPAWVSHAQSFDSFFDHFCPQANGAAKARFIDQVENFFDVRLPIMKCKSLQATASQRAPVYGNKTQWVKCNRLDPHPISPWQTLPRH